MLRLGALLGVGLLVTALPAAAQAPAKEAEGQRLYEEGRRLYDISDYDGAIAKFKAAYKLSDAPGLLYNIAQAYRLKRDCAQAVVFYRRYLVREPAPPSKPQVEGFLAEMERCAARQPEPPPASTAAPPGPMPAPETAASPPEPPPRPGEPPAGRGRGKRLAGLVLGGAALAATATAVWFGLRAGDAADEVTARSREVGANWSAELESVEARGERDERIAIVLSAGAGALAVAGGVLYVLGRREARSPSFAVAVPSRGGAVLSWGCDF